MLLLRLQLFTIPFSAISNSELIVSTGGIDMDYVRVGNRTFTMAERALLTPKQITEIKAQADRAHLKRLENMRLAAGGTNPQAMTLDVTPAGIAKRAAAIAAEEAKIKSETAVVDAELGTAGSFLGEGEPSVDVSMKKSKEQRAEEKKQRAEEKAQKAEATASH
jgi:hypothetical protein